MYVLACILIYGDRRRDLCCDPAGSQESTPELGVGFGSLRNGRLRVGIWLKLKELSEIFQRETKGN
jgi:hypothetical protein